MRFPLISLLPRHLCTGKLAGTRTPTSPLLDRKAIRGTSGGDQVLQARSRRASGRLRVHLEPLGLLKGAIYDRGLAQLHADRGPGGASQAVHYFRTALQRPSQMNTNGYK